MTFINMIRAAQGQRLLVGGHRGHLSNTRENTIANFEEVLLAGVEYIEIDVQLSKDQQPVIFHDRNLDDRTPLSGNVRDYTVAEMKAAFDLCTLEEAMYWCKTKKMYMLLEIKGHDLVGKTEKEIWAQRIADCLKRYQFEHQCILLGIDQSILKQIKQSVPEVEIALIVPQSPADPVAYLKEVKASIYLSFIEDMNEELVKELHKADIIVDGSVVNSPELLERALAMGVDMIESDYPAEIYDLYLQKTEVVENSCAL